MSDEQRNTVGRSVYDAVKLEAAHFCKALEPFATPEPRNLQENVREKRRVRRCAADAMVHYSIWQGSSTDRKCQRSPLEQFAVELYDRVYPGPELIPFTRLMSPKTT